MDDFMEAAIAEAKNKATRRWHSIGSVLVGWTGSWQRHNKRVKTVILSPTLKSIAYATPVESAYKDTTSIPP